MDAEVRRALKFATDAHGAINHVRKYTGEPYIVHPIEVMTIVASVPHTKEMLMAALLHDTVEDTPVTIEDIQAEFGDAVATLVGWLTDVSKPTDGKRVVRKSIDRQHTADAPAEAQTVKLADLLSNSKSILEHDLNFAAVYLEEKALMLDVMTKGDATLFARAKAEVTRGQSLLLQDKLAKMENKGEVNV
jgi:(p)ppGpp synthase/HD superfamily hydrolase